jgi:hypothetical protein
VLCGEGYSRFERTPPPAELNSPASKQAGYCCCLLGQFFDPEDGGICSSETSVDIYQTIVISQKLVPIMGIAMEAPECTNCEDVGYK